MSTVILLLPLLMSAHCLSVQNNKKPHILCVGVAGMDFVATVPHFPQADEKMRSDSLLADGGGNAANTACAMGRLSNVVDVSLATAVGRDANGDAIVKGLEENHVQHTEDYIERYDGTSPFTYVLACNDEEHGNTRTCIHQPSNRDLTEEFLDESIPNVEDFTAVHFDVRHPKAAVRLAKRCVEHGTPYSVDVERPRDGLLELLSGATVVICNTGYCDLILGNDVPEKESETSDRNVVKRLRHLILGNDAPEEKSETSDGNVVKRLRQVMSEQAPNAKLAVTTLGAKGSCLVRLDGAFQENGVVLETKEDEPNAPKVTIHDGAMWCEAWRECKVVDSTGAGDSFQGGFLAALWAFAAQQPHSASIAEMDTRVFAHALRIGTRVSGKKLEAAGARQGLPFGDQDEFLRSEFQSLLQLELASESS